MTGAHPGPFLRASRLKFTSSICPDIASFWIRFTFLSRWTNAVPAPDVHQKYGASWTRHLLTQPTLHLELGTAEVLLMAFLLQMAEILTAAFMTPIWRLFATLVKLKGRPWP